MNNSTIEFYFNSNAAWHHPRHRRRSPTANAATTPNLTYNDSGQPGATNGRFLGTTSLLSTLAIGNCAPRWSTRSSTSP